MPYRPLAMRKSGRKTDTNRDALISSAADLWVAFGPSAISFGAVAQRAGVTKSLTAYHFSTTEALRLAAARELVAQTLAALVPFLDDLAAMPSHRVTGPRIWARLAEFMVQAPYQRSTALLEIASLAIRSDSYRRLLAAFLERLRRLLSGLGIERQPTSMRNAAATLIGATLSQSARRQGSHFLTGFEDILQEAFAWQVVPRCPAAQKIQVSPVDLAPIAGTRDRILTAALHLLADQPTGSFSHRQLADAAGVSLSSTTYYFSSKEAILEATLNRAIEGAREAVTLDFPREHLGWSEINQFIERASRYYLGEGLTATLTHLNLSLYAARSSSLTPAMEEFYELQLKNFRHLLGEDSIWTQENRLLFLYDLINGHLLLCLLRF